MKTKRTKKPTKGDPTKAVALLRVSTAEQDLGPEAQRLAINRWAHANGVTVVECFEERVSGGAELSERQGLIDALVAVQQHGAGILVVAKQDRLARSVMNYLLIEERVKGMGAAIVCASGEGAGSGPEAQLMRTIVAAVAEWERMTIAMRTKAAMAIMKSKNLRVGSVPTGKRLDPEDPKRLIDEPLEMQAVALARRGRENGLSLREISAELAALGHLSRAGTPYGARAILRWVG